MKSLLQPSGIRSVGNGSEPTAEPKTGDEAAQSDATEAEDDVEFPEAVVLIGKTHWRCVPCMLLQPRTVSIDDHIKIDHVKSEVPSVSESDWKEHGRGRKVTQNKVSNQLLTKRKAETMKLAKSAQHHGQRGEERKTGFGKEISRDTKLQFQRGRGRAGRRSKCRRGGRGRGVRGRGKDFSKSLISDDSDTEIEAAATSPSTSTSSLKRKTISGLGAGKSAEAVDANGSINPAADILDSQCREECEDTMPSSPSCKKAKTGNEEITDLHETVLETGNDQTSALHEAVTENSVSSPHLSPAEASMKDLMKEKYVVFVGKTGTSECLSESEVHMENDPPLPIETPSLQADTLLPPATPLLPDLQGPPETPVPPDTPHLSELHHPPDSFQSQGAADLQYQYSSQPQDLLSSVAQGNVPGIAQEHLSRLGSSADPEMIGSHLVAEEVSVFNRPVCSKELPSSSVCRICKIVFEDLRLHREQMGRFDVVACNSCGDKFHGLHQLNSHVFTVHEKFAPMFCFFCDADCGDSYELEEHLLEHISAETGEGTGLDSIEHVCKVCGVRIAGSASDLVNHYHITHNQWICTTCYNLFTDATQYEHHRELPCSAAEPHVEPVVYACPVSDCFHICQNREALMDHISWHEDCELEEEQQSLLYCHHCNASFYSAVSLQRHLAEGHNEADLRPFVCELCSAAFSRSLELHEHNTTHHSGVKRYGCAYCDQRFVFCSVLRYHIASEHDVAATVLRM